MNTTVDTAPTGASEQRQENDVEGYRFMAGVFLRSWLEGRKSTAATLEGLAEGLGESVDELDVLVYDLDGRVLFDNDRERRDWDRVKEIARSIRFDLTAIRSAAKEAARREGGAS